jgi:hypothetical protein
MVPFCDFGVSEDRVVAAGNSSFQTTGDAVVGRVVSFCVAGGVLFILPVTILRFVESVPDRDILVVTGNDECCVVEVVIDNSGICPSTI